MARLHFLDGQNFDWSESLNKLNEEMHRPVGKIVIAVEVQALDLVSVAVFLPIVADSDEDGLQSFDKKRELLIVEAWICQTQKVISWIECEMI